MHPMLHGLQSTAAGREVFVDKPHIRIRVAGYDKDEFFGPVTNQMKERFPEEWDAFQRKVEAPSVGTPVGNWPHLFSQPSQVKNLLSLGFRTVEDLAAAADMALQKIGMGGYKLRDEARKYLSQSQTQADVARLEELEAKSAADAQTLADQAAKIAALEAQMAEILKAQTDAEAPRKPRKATA